VHEIKHDGYRLIVRRDGKAVRLFTRRGYDWTDRYPAIARAAAKLRAMSFTIDGEAVVAGADGIAIFDALHRRGTVTDAMLYAFDLVELDGKDLRPQALGDRKAKLAKLLARAPVGIIFNEHTDEDGVVVFRHACKMGLEGIVSKRLSKPISRAGPGTGSRSRRTRTARRWCDTGPGRGSHRMLNHTTGPLAERAAAFRVYLRRRKREIVLSSASSASALRILRASRKISTRDNCST
jgi:bifunctional non-homologous end joining protein LigD